MTNLQADVWHFIRTFILSRDRAPTYAEIREACGIRTDVTVRRVTKFLVDEGLLRRDFRHRWTVLVPTPDKLDGGLPRLGYVVVDDVLSDADDNTFGPPVMQLAGLACIHDASRGCYYFFDEATRIRPGDVLVRTDPFSLSSSMDTPGSVLGVLRYTVIPGQKPV